MPFRATFDCLWCGRPHRTRDGSDLEGRAWLCPECVGRAQDNEFLRFRLRAALRDRAAASHPGRSEGNAIADQGHTEATPHHPASGPATATATRADADGEMRAYYAARAPEYDDWYLRRGRYSRGPVIDLAWHQELDEATRWLDGQPFRGEIVELAAGTGWWSPLLASKGQLSLYDVNEEPLDRARERLLAHGLRAHIHVRDAWEEPDRQVDGLFCGFWLSHVPRERLDAFLRLARRWLKPDGLFCFIDSRDDPASGAVDGQPSQGDVAVRRLADGRQFRIPKVFYESRELEVALAGAGFSGATVRTTPRFFLLGSATA
jgi:ubiquinone/menaquinone biosynthesis C-methylase UbiE